jgi:hypothetical protein
VLIQLIALVLLSDARYDWPGLSSTGIFRESGLQSNMKKIKESLDKGVFVSVYGPRVFGGARQIANIMALQSAFLALHSLTNQSKTTPTPRVHINIGALLSEQDVADVNDVAGALKLYVRELPEGLLASNWFVCRYISNVHISRPTNIALCTYANFSAFLDTLDIPSDDNRIEEMRGLQSLCSEINLLCFFSPREY